MALVVFIRGVNVGGHRTFRPSVLARGLSDYGVVNVGAAGTFVVRKPGSRAKFRAALLRKLPFKAEVVLCDGRELIRLELENPFGAEPVRRDIVRFVSILSRAGGLRAALPVTVDPEKSGAMMRTELLRFNGAVERDPAIDAWMKEHSGELGAIAHQWFEVMRKCGDEVRELLHDGCPVACLGDAPFGYVNVFRSHVNVGFFHGAALPDPAHLLQGTGKFMRHVKLRPGTATNAAALSRLIDTAYSDIKARVENG